MKGNLNDIAEICLNAIIAFEHALKTMSPGSRPGFSMINILGFVEPRDEAPPHEGFDRHVRAAGQSRTFFSGCPA
jgi:hypothetical protein